jgi:triacylglycerol esterase/lipase EstA (alpha/beta hydrolase family)
LVARRVRQLRRSLTYLKGYFAFDRNGNAIVRRTDFTNCRRPVLLLYGFMATRRTFEVLEHRLRRDQFCVFSLNLGGWREAFNTNAIDDLAEHVSEKIERLYQRFPEMGPLSVIGHSKGGLIGAYYVKRLGGDRRVKGLITLGTPHNGSPSAYWGVAAMGLISRSIWQLTPRSPFIHQLKEGAFPGGVRLVSVYSQADRVNPYPSCFVDNPTLEPHVVNVEVPGVLHREFVTSRSVYQVVRRELFTTYGLPTPDEPRPRRLLRLA